MTTKSRYVGLRLPTELYQAAKDRADAQSAKTGLRVTVSDVLRVALSEALKPAPKGWMVRILDASGVLVEESGPMPENHATRMVNHKNRQLRRQRDPSHAPVAVKVREP